MKLSAAHTWHEQNIMKGQIEDALRCTPWAQREVGEHEPVSALDGGGAEGLAALRAITTAAVSMLQPGAAAAQFQIAHSLGGFDRQALQFARAAA